MGCGGYLDKIYKILVDILILNLVFHLRIFSCEATFFVRKQQKLGLDPNFFSLKKVTNYREFRKKLLRTKKSASKTGLIRKVVYLSADLNAGPFKGRFPLVC